MPDRCDASTRWADIIPDDVHVPKIANVIERPLVYRNPLVLPPIRRGLGKATV